MRSGFAADATRLLRGSISLNQERHKARHSLKDRYAGGHGLGVLHTKKKAHGAAEIPEKGHDDQRRESTSDSHRNDLPRNTEHHAEEGSVQPLQSPDLCEDTGSTTIHNDDQFVDFPEFGGMYHDTNFNLFHFDVMGMSAGLVKDCSAEALPDEDERTSTRTSDDPFATTPGELSTPLDTTKGAYDESYPLASAFPQSDAHGNSTQYAELQSQISALAEKIANTDRLQLNHLQLSPSKRREVIDLIAEIRPVHPDGSIVDENSGDFTMETMQSILDLFFLKFNTSYPMIHSATFEVNDANPLVLLSMMILGATYQDRETHQISVCMYDAIIPHILSGLLSIPVPDLSTLQAFLILECYGMYRAGPFQRENAILIHSLLFNAIRRVSRYHVRSRIMLPDSLTRPEEDWKAFAHNEQYKRLVLFVFMWDTQNVSFYSFMPSMSTQSIQIELPCSKRLWEARSDIEWRDALRYELPNPVFSNAVNLFVENGSSLDSHCFDGLSLNLILHGLMSMFNDLVHFDNQSIYLGYFDANGRDFAPCRERMLMALERWKMKYDSFAMEATQTTEDTLARNELQKENIGFLSLYHMAHIIVTSDIRHLQIAAGSKALFGHIVTEADRDDSVKLLKQWAQASPNSAGHAAWHAALMFQEGLLNLNKWQVNGIFHYPWCLFIGTLACWAVHHFNSEPTARKDCLRSAKEKFSDEQTRALMNNVVSQMVSSNPSDIGKVLAKSCSHGLAVEIAKHLKTIRWTAAFEAMKILEQLP
ncbi:hypothetical protein DV736_g2803, partial [Chaetothyriales sp. CBS 134916]